MSTLSIDRPGLNQTCLNMLDAIWLTPSRVAHAHEMRQAAEQVFAMSDADLAARGVTRQQALLRIAQSV
jgi:sulfur transfer complex TusBCD TusB component (DsrH family)